MLAFLAVSFLTIKPEKKRNLLNEKKGGGVKSELKYLKKIGVCATKLFFVVIDAPEKISETVLSPKSIFSQHLNLAKKPALLWPQGVCRLLALFKI